MPRQSVKTAKFFCNSTMNDSIKDFMPQRQAPVYNFSIDVKLLTLKLIECCKGMSYE